MIGARSRVASRHTPSTIGSARGAVRPRACMAPTERRMDSTSASAAAATSAEAKLGVQILCDFPPLVSAFAYGSAIFSQRGYSEAQKNSAMIDLVFVVDDAAAWHASNLESNPSHYSGIARAILGSRGVAYAQEHIGAGIYYNQCWLRDRRIKYGVISRKALADDLEHWSSLYVSGRLHKPVRSLVPWPHDLESLIASNRRAAVSASLVLLPERFQPSELWSTLCGLSYAGDVRMGVGESPAKPLDIASGQQEALAQLYAAPLAETFESPEGQLEGQPEGSGGSDTAGGPAAEMVQQIGLAARRRHLRLLPMHAQHALLGELSAAGIGELSAAAVGALSPSPSSQAKAVAEELDAAACSLWTRSQSDQDASRRLARATASSLARIVRKSSLAQTLKGVATAGVATSITYAMEKMRKRSRRGG